MLRVAVTMTQADISGGVACPANCPLALAINRAVAQLPEVDRVMFTEVGQNDIGIVDVLLVSGGEERELYGHLPEGTDQFIEDFDEDKFVAVVPPFGLYLDVLGA